MKKEIKFKAKYKNKIYSVLSIDFERNEVKIFEKDKPVFDAIILTVDFSEVELLEYTGLVDKNGKDVYEGDILKSITCSRRISDGKIMQYGIKKTYLIKKDKYGCYSIDEDHIGCDVEDSMKSRANFAEIYTKSSEVVGNIHENSELLS